MVTLCFAKNSVILFFEAAYFCCLRAYGMLGTGVENCITILIDENFSMRMDLSQEAIEKCQYDVDQRIGRSTIFNKDYLVKIDKQNKKLELRKNSHCINIPVSSRRLNQI